MCMMLYLAADVPLRTVEWREDAPGFHTSPSTADEERVRCQFTKPNLFYVGSYEGCACGFQLGEYPPDWLDPDEVVERRRSLREFAEYLREELRRAGTIELYACWDGDQEKPPVHHRTLTPASLEADTFYFLQRERSTVIADAG
jgi:hypothetical protein